MARKKTRRRTRTIRAKAPNVRYVYRNKKRKPQSTMSKAMRYLIPLGYGFARDKVNDMIMNSRIGQELPVTNFTDEGVMLGAGYLASMMGLTKNASIRKLVSHSRTIELSNIGRTLSDLQQGTLSGSKKAPIGQTSVSTGVYVYQ